MMLVSITLHFIRQIFVVKIFDGDGCHLVVDQELEALLCKFHIVLCRIKGRDDEFSPAKIFYDVEVFFPLEIAGTVDVVVQTARTSCDTKIFE